MKKQKDTFESTIKMKESIQNLAGFVQNDFDLMIEDGILKEEILNSIGEMDKTFDDVIDKLNSLREDYREILKYHGT